MEMWSGPCDKKTKIRLHKLWRNQVGKHTETPEAMEEDIDSAGSWNILHDMEKEVSNKSDISSTGVTRSSEKRLTGNRGKLTYSPAVGCQWLCLAGV